MPPPANAEIQHQHRKPHIKRELVEIVARRVGPFGNHETRPDQCDYRQRRDEIADPARFEIHTVGAVFPQPRTVSPITKIGRRTVGGDTRQRGDIERRVDDRRVGNGIPTVFSRQGEGEHRRVG